MPARKHPKPKQPKGQDQTPMVQVPLLRMNAVEDMFPPEQVAVVRALWDDSTTVSFTHCELLLISGLLRSVNVTGETGLATVLSVIQKAKAASLEIMARHPQAAELTLTEGATSGAK